MAPCPLGTPEGFQLPATAQEPPAVRFHVSAVLPAMLSVTNWPPEPSGVVLERIVNAAALLSTPSPGSAQCDGAFDIKEVVGSRDNVTGWSSRIDRRRCQAPLATTRLPVRSTMLSGAWCQMHS